MYRNLFTALVNDILISKKFSYVFLKMCEFFVKKKLNHARPGGDEYFVYGHSLFFLYQFKKLTSLVCYKQRHALKKTSLL